jgi:hypothetical protein
MAMVINYLVDPHGTNIAEMAVLADGHCVARSVESERYDIYIGLYDDLDLSWRRLLHASNLSELEEERYLRLLTQRIVSKGY